MTKTFHYAVPGASFETLRKKQREYLEWLIAEAKSNGMGVGLKNAQSHIPDVADGVAFAINEQCQQYDECDVC
jgi:O-succinylbenzoate synthase